MGFGHHRIDGYVNVDAQAACHPDQVVDLEQTPWPWPTGCATEVRFIHSLEHMGQAPKTFLSMMSELYRIVQDGGTVTIHAPHPRHDAFLSDPTHVRAITPETLRLFDRDLNDRWREDGTPNTPLAHYLGVDFALTNRTVILSEPYARRFRQGDLSPEAADLLVATQNNIAHEYQMTLRVRKPAQVS